MKNAISLTPHLMLSIKGSLFELVTEFGKDGMSRADE